MDNKKLIAPKPVRMNPFASKNLTKISHIDKRLFYRKSDRVKSEIIINNHCKLNDDSLEISELEKDFSEIDARSEIYTILLSDVSSSSFAQRDTIVSNSSFEEAIEETLQNNIRQFNSYSKNFN